MHNLCQVDCRMVEMALEMMSRSRWCGREISHLMQSLGIYSEKGSCSKQELHVCNQWIAWRRQLTIATMCYELIGILQIFPNPILIGEMLPWETPSRTRTNPLFCRKKELINIRSISSVPVIVTTLSRYLRYWCFLRRNEVVYFAPNISVA